MKKSTDNPTTDHIADTSKMIVNNPRKGVDKNEILPGCVYCGTPGLRESSEIIRHKYDGDQKVTVYRICCTHPACPVLPETRDADTPEQALEFWTTRYDKRG